jgi:hypothetical protein
VDRTVNGTLVIDIWVMVIVLTSVLVRMEMLVSDSKEVVVIVTVWAGARTVVIITLPSDTVVVTV